MMKLTRYGGATRAFGAMWTAYTRVGCSTVEGQ